MMGTVSGRRMTGHVEEFSASRDMGMRLPDGTVADAFKFRIHVQQFLTAYAPIFAAAAELGDSSAQHADGNRVVVAMRKAAELARHVAKAIATEQAAHEVFTHIRPAAAQTIASIWKQAGLDSITNLDVEAVAKAHAGAFALVSEADDVNSWHGKASLSEADGLRGTAEAVTLRLLQPVMSYDFRRDPEELLATLSSVVLRQAHSATGQIVPDEAKRDAHRSMLQTSANRLADIMASAYSWKVKQIATILAPMSETERDDFLRQYDPLPDVVGRFHTFSRLYLQIADTNARRLLNLMPERVEAPSP